MQRIDNAIQLGMGNMRRVIQRYNWVEEPITITGGGGDDESIESGYNRRYEQDMISIGWLTNHPIQHKHITIIITLYLMTVLLAM